MKLDLITSKEAHKKVRGKHYGSKLARRIIDKHHPIIAVGGHIHEGRGVQKIGKTLVVNQGAIHGGRYAIIEIDEDNTRKIKMNLSNSSILHQNHYAPNKKLLCPFY